MDNNKLAELLFPHIKTTAQQYREEIYPKRELPEGAMVTRFAPSPTGFLHIGGVFTSLVNERCAHQSGGVFLLHMSSRKPTTPKPIAQKSTSPAFESINLYRTAAEIARAIIKITPPIVGVPLFFSCHLGPISRILCPNFNFIRTGINTGPKSAEAIKPNNKAIM